jgi:hypothetical protein
VIEQLPLTLHRMFALLRELDERYTCECGRVCPLSAQPRSILPADVAQIAELQQTIRRYVSLRQTIDRLSASQSTSGPPQGKSSTAVNSESLVADNPCT